MVFFCHRQGGHNTQCNRTERRGGSQFLSPQVSGAETPGGNFKPGIRNPNRSVFDNVTVQEHPTESALTSLHGQA